MKLINDAYYTLEDICSIADGNVHLRLDDSEGFALHIRRGSQFLEHLLAEEGVIYGVTTGYGDSVTSAVPVELAYDLSQALYTFHGCGMGEVFSVRQARAIVAVRLVNLAKGFSGVRYELLNLLVQLLNKNVVPVMPSEGSVGASGDLTPLSYLAAVLEGKRFVYHEGNKTATTEAFEKVGIDRLRLQPKEGLAIMNGTAVMTALACLAYRRISYLCDLSTRLTAMCSYALQGNVAHFHPRLFAVKPHPGQCLVAERIYEDLKGISSQRNSNRLQDRYSLRCAPHVIGVVVDALTQLRSFIEIEVNSANDNPIIDGEHELVLHGGHFYGGHIAFAMDSLKVAIANVADLLDRQFAQLVDTKFNNGLPANLSGATSNTMLNHGFKAVQIAVSSWTAEALHLCGPMSVFSRSTECHNQDKVSMGTIAARQCLRIVELVEQVVAASLIAFSQAVELRTAMNVSSLSPNIATSLNSLRENVDFLDLDRELDADLKLIVELIRERAWNWYD